jgi:hypothetical protein
LVHWNELSLPTPAQSVTDHVDSAKRKQLLSPPNFLLTLRISSSAYIKIMEKPSQGQYTLAAVSYSKFSRHNPGSALPEFM